MKKALLIRCKYPYGKVSQVWLPMDLHKIAASFEAAGTPTDVVDLNLETLPPLDSYDHIGIGVIGMPYIPGTQAIAREVYEKTGKKPLIGGQIIQAFRPDEFESIYPNAIQISGHIAEDILDKNTRREYRWYNPTLEALGIKAPPVAEVSVEKRIKQMPDDLLKKYLQNDFGFYVSQGCKFSCDFCGIQDKGKQEKFSKTMEGDLDALCESALRFGLPGMKMYLSSLDLFQNPRQFKDTLEIFARARQKYNLDIRVRGLSCTLSFLNALHQVPEFYDLIPAAGLDIVGLGIDGVTKKEWLDQHKPMTNLSDAEYAFGECKRVGITPESLMVMGMHAIGTFKCDIQALEKTVRYSIEWAEKYGAVCRPHVAKLCSPNNEGWKSEQWASLRARLVKNPELFKNLDYLMMATPLSHPDPETRTLVNEAYMAIIDNLGPRRLCATNPLMPYYNGKGMYDKEYNAAMDLFNSSMPCDR